MRFHPGLVLILGACQPDRPDATGSDSTNPGERMTLPADFADDLTVHMACMGRVVAANEDDTVALFVRFHPPWFDDAPDDGSAWTREAAITPWELEITAYVGESVTGATCTDLIRIPDIDRRYVVIQGDARVTIEPDGHDAFVTAVLTDVSFAEDFGGGGWLEPATTVSELRLPRIRMGSDPPG